MKKYKLTYLLFISLSLVLYSQSKKRILTDTVESPFLKASKNSPISKTIEASGNTYHYNSGDFGSSKYDKEINWDADINENDVQGSLDRFRNERRNEEIKEYTFAILKVIGVVAIILISFFSLTGKNRYR